MKEVVVSVVIPIYNGEKYLKSTIESVLRQPCKQFEIILIKDGSSDSTDAICCKYASENSHICYIKKENTGVSDTRNVGIKCAVGKYISFLDADDCWCSEFLTEDLVKQLESEDKDIYGFHYYKSNEKMTKGNKVSAIIANGDAFHNSRNHFCSYIFKRGLFDRVLFNTASSLSEDNEFLFKIFLTSKSYMGIDKPIFIYRNNSDSVTHSLRGDIFIY